MKQMRVWTSLAVVLMAGSGALAAVRTVPGQYAGIQKAIDAAEAGDTVIVSRGTYEEAIDFKGKNIVVRSTDPNDPATVAATTILFTTDTTNLPRGATPTGSAVTFVHGEGPGAVLAGFTIMGGYGSVPPSYGSTFSIWGGGIICYRSSPTITRNVVMGNIGPKGSAGTQYSYGGGIACLYSNATVVRNVIQGNSAYYGGGVYVNAGNSTICDNLIYDNSATIGGGVVVYDNGSLTNNTIVRNTAGTGGGIFVASQTGYPTYNVTNNIIAHGRGGGSVYIATTSDWEYLAFNDIWSNVGGSDPAWPQGWNVGGNISADPMFVDIANEDFHLQAESPCINAGDPNRVVPVGETDVYGNPRVDRGRVDIGAAEFSGDYKPVAKAGPDQSMTAVPAIVTLDGSGSYDPDPGTILSYSWSQVSGSPVTLDVNGPIARFSPGGCGVFAFQLVVSDGIMDSAPATVRVVIDNGRLPIAEAGLPVYTGGESVKLNGSDSHTFDGSTSVGYHWQQISGPSTRISDANVVSPEISGFVRTNMVQICVFQLTVDDGAAYGLPDSVEVRVVPNTPGVTINRESSSFDPNKPSVFYFDGGDCSVSNGGSWNSSSWSQLANVFNVNYQTGSRSSAGTYEGCGDAMILYLFRLAPNYKMPIQTIGYSTGGQPAIDVGIRLNLTYKDTRYAVNRVTFVDGCCRTYTQSVAQYAASSVDGEQCWLDSYWSGYCSTMLWPGAMNVKVSGSNNHSEPPSYYKASLTNANMNKYNGGLVAGAYWSVLGSGKNLQLAVAPNRQIYEYKAYNAVSSGYEYAQFYDQTTYPAKLPEPVTLLEPVDGGDPCGAILTCKPSQNAVGYQLLLGRDPYRVQDFTVVAESNEPPTEVIRTLPFEKTYWTVRARDAYGSTIYADPILVDAFRMSLPVQNVRTGTRYGSIQTALNAAAPGDEIRLKPGTYHEKISVSAGVHIRSLNLDDPSAAAGTILIGDGTGSVVTCTGTASTSFLLSGLTITHGGNGISCSGGSLTLTDCRVTANTLAGIKLADQCHLTAVNCLVAGNKGAGVEMTAATASRGTPYNYATLTNCTITENQGKGVWGSVPTVVNSIVWNNAGVQVTGDTVVVTYSDIQGGYPGPGNLDADPRFVQPGSWNAGIWTEGDYHLQSQGWRWNPATGAWTSDEATSPCIDAGVPSSSLANEPTSIPGVGPVSNPAIDQGFYGGTPQASVKKASL